MAHKDIQNEVEALITISENEGHLNIISILHHGRLPASDYHFIHMELCNMDLHDYIHGVKRVNVEPKFQDSSDLVLVRDCSVRLRMQNVFTIIMSHVSKGLKFMYERQYIHRDLKPRDGTHS